MRIRKIALVLALGILSLSCSSIQKATDINSENCSILDNSCSHSGEESEVVATCIHCDADSPQYKGGNFAFRLFKESSNGYTSNNTVVSPISVSILLSMLANGDVSVSRDNILKVLGYGPSQESVHTLNEYNRTTVKNLPTFYNGKMIPLCRLANSCWHDKDISLTDRYYKILVESYNIEDIETAPYGEKGMKAINKWVNEYTDGLIPEFLKSPLLRNFIVLNVVYLKAEWLNTFSSEETMHKQFNNLEGNTSEVPFMTNINNYEYAKYKDAQILVMPYVSGLEFIAISPTPEMDFNNFIEDLTYDDLLNSYAKLKKSYINLSFPKFESESNEDITSILKSMGLGLALENGLNSAAEIDGSPTIVSIEKLLHSVTIKLTERGTEAGACTAAVMYGSTKKIQPPEPINVTFDRPFIYIIRDSSSGAILFMGKVTKL